LLKWKDIWENRTEVDGPLLYNMLVMNGYDAGIHKIDPDEVAAATKEYRDALGIQPQDSIYEVGCGCGAVLYIHSLFGNRVAGSDYSQSQIERAKKYCPQGQFECSEANAIPIEPKFDFVLANGVFLYFPDYGYAETVIEKMLQKARKAVYVEAVPDAAKKKEAIWFKKKAIGEEEYYRRHVEGGLAHLYYEKAWFEEIGRKHGAEVSIRPLNITSWSDNNDFKYNCILRACS